MYLTETDNNRVQCCRQFKIQQITFKPQGKDKRRNTGIFGKHLTHAKQGKQMRYCEIYIT